MADKPIEAAGEEMVVDINLIDPDPENPNRLTEGERRKLQLSLQRSGQTLPVIVRKHPKRKGRWMIVDGENRWTGMVASGSKRCRILYVPKYDDPREAHLAMLSHNYIRGTPDHDKLKDMARDLEKRTVELGEPLEELRALIPFEESQWVSLLDTDSSSVPLDDYIPRDYVPPPQPKQSNYTFRLTFSNDQALRGFVSKMVRLCREAGVLGEEPTGPLQVPVADLGDILYIIVSAINLKVLGARVAEEMGIGEERVLTQ